MSRALTFSLQTWMEGSRQMVRISARTKDTRKHVGYQEYTLCPVQERVFIKMHHVEPRYRRKGIGMQLFKEILMVTPHTYRVDPIKFTSKSGREFWKKARYVSKRVIPATEVDRLNRERKGVVYGVSSPDKLQRVKGKA